MDYALGFILATAFVFPLIHVAISRRSSGNARLGWFLAVVFFSWIGWVVFLICTHSKKDDVT